MLLRWCKKYLVWVYGVALCAAVWGVFYHLKPFLWSYVQNTLRQHARIELQASSFHLSVLPLGVVLHKVHLTSTDPVYIWSADVDVVRAHMALWPYWNKKWRIGEVVLEGVDAGVVDVAQFTQNPSSNTSELPLDVLSVRIDAKRMGLRQHEHTVWLEKARVGLKGGGLLHDVHVSAQRVGYRFQNTTWEVVPAFEGVLHGDLFRPQSVDVQSLSVRVLDGLYEAEGVVPLHGSKAWDLRVQVESTVGRFADRWPSLPSLEGNAHVSLVVTGPMLAPHVRYVCEVEQAVFKNHALGHVWLEGVFHRNHLNVEFLDIKEEVLGHVSGSAVLDLEKHTLSSLHLSLERGSLGKILDVSGVSGAWVDMDVSGSVKGDGTLKPFALNLETTLHVDTFDTYNASYTNLQADTLLHIEKAQVAGSCGVSSEGVVLKGVQIAGKHTRLNVTGMLWGNGKKGMDLHVEGALDMQDVGAVAQVPFAGEGHVKVRLHGPYAALKIEGPLHFKGFSFLTYDVGEIFTEAVFFKDTLFLNKVSLGPAAGAVGQGELRFVFGKEVSLVADMRLSKAPLSLLLGALRWDKALISPFMAEVSGVFHTEGPLRALKGGGSLGTDMLYVENEPLGPAETTVYLWQDTSPLTVQLHVSAVRGAFECVYEQGWEPGVLGLKMKAYGLDASVLSPFLKGLPLSGEWSGKAFLEGTFHSLRGSMDVAAQNMSASGLALGDVRLHADVADGQAAWKGTLWGDAVDVKGTLQMQAPWNHHAYAVFEKFQVNRLLEIPYQALVWASGSLETSGFLSAPESLKMVWDVQKASVQVSQLQAHLGSPVRVLYSEGLYRIPTTEWTGQGAVVRVDGHVKPAQGWDLRAEFFADMSLFEGVDKNLAGMRGPVSFSGVVKGDWERPDVVGEAQWQEGTWTLPYFEQQMDRIYARCVFINRRMVLKKAVARLGGGGLEAEGSVEWPSADRSLYTDMRMQLKNVLVYPSAQMEVGLSGDLDVSGYDEDRILKGRLWMDTLRYTAHVELERLLPKKVFSPTQFQNTLDGHPLQLAVKIEGTKNIVVSSNVLEAELQLDLLVTGTTHRVGLLGSVTPQWARAYYRDNVFTIQRATIDFVDEFRLFSQFSVHAKTQACGMSVDVNVEGDSDQFHVYASGRDEKGVVNTEDVLSCVHLGLRTQDFGSNQAAPAGLLDVGTVGIDALWSVTGLDRRVKKILPIKVDEIRLTNTWSSVNNRTTPHLVVGKELGKRAHVRYSRSLIDEKDQTLNINYQFMKPLSLQGSWFGLSDVPVGDFGVDLKWHWEMK